MSNFLRILENEVQITALIFMGTVYVFRIVWIFRFKPSRERTTPAGSKKAGITYSLMNITMPWAMESARKKPTFYAQFVIFHLGVAAAITATFIIPYWPEAFEIKAVAWLFQVVIAAALIVGLIRLYRRVRKPAVRLISTLDDYLSLIFVIFYFAAGFLAIPNRYQAAEWPLILFFGLTAFFLAYVPFSKISHYLYYPFTRYFLGKTLGHRGVFPVKRKKKEMSVEPTKK
jgi:nitrate reductase gamma subunit